LDFREKIRGGGRIRLKMGVSKRDRAKDREWKFIKIQNTRYKEQNVGSDLTPPWIFTRKSEGVGG